MHGDVLDRALAHDPDPASVAQRLPVLGARPHGRHFMVLGSQSTIPGKIMMSTVGRTRAIIRMRGPVWTLMGLTLGVELTTRAIMPTGEKPSPMETISIDTTPNHTGSKPIETMRGKVS